MLRLTVLFSVRCGEAQLWMWHPWVLGLCFPLQRIQGDIFFRYQFALGDSILDLSKLTPVRNKSFGWNLSWPAFVLIIDFYPITQVCVWKHFIMICLMRHLCYSMKVTDLFFFNLGLRQRYNEPKREKTETERAPMHGFTHQMPTITRAGLGQSQDPRTRCRSPMQWAGIQLLEPSPLTPRVYITRELKLALQCGMQASWLLGSASAVENPWFNFSLSSAEHIQVYHISATTLETNTSTCLCVVPVFYFLVSCTILGMMSQVNNSVL